MEARDATFRDKESWLQIRRTIWPHASSEAHERDIEEGFARRDGRWFVVVVEDLNPVAYVECRVHPAQDGGEATAGRIEAWYIVPNYRAGGVGGALIGFLRAWFQAHGCARLEAHEDLGADIAFRANLDALPQDNPLRFKFGRR